MRNIIHRLLLAIHDPRQRHVWAAGVICGDLIILETVIGRDITIQTLIRGESTIARNRHGGSVRRVVSDPSERISLHTLVVSEESGEMSVLSVRLHLIQIARVSQHIEGGVPLAGESNIVVDGRHHQVQDVRIDTSFDESVIVHIRDGDVERIDIRMIHILRPIIDPMTGRRLPTEIHGSGSTDEINFPYTLLASTDRKFISVVSGGGAIDVWSSQLLRSVSDQSTPADILDTSRRPVRSTPNYTSI